MVRLFLALAAALTVSSAQAADSRNGEALARRWCASCHVVAPDQRGTASEAPPFASIAKRPDFDARAVAFFLLNPHPKMPDMGLSRPATEDIAAYIASLK